MSNVDELTQLCMARYDQGGIGVLENISLLDDEQQFAAAPTTFRSTLARGFELDVFGLVYDSLRDR
jgi:hypothetical protein